MEHLIRHLSTYTYEPAPLRASLRLKLFPVDFESQQVLEWSVHVNGEEVSPLVLMASGDREGLWAMQDPPDRLEIIAQGKVETRDTTGVVRGLPGTTPPRVYLRETPLTEADDAIRAFAGDLAADEPLATMHALMGAIHERIAYVSGSTDGSTTAADALAAGNGVCQDHAHLLISAARVSGIPARYVTGYMQPEGYGDPVQVQDGDGQSQIQQIGNAPELLETHAWAEAFIDGIGWVGFDPSCNLCPTDRYVRLCCGEDAFDAAPIRGNILGETTESLEVSVAIGQSQQ